MQMSPFYYSPKRTQILFPLLFCIISVTLFSGCTQRYGNLNHTREITQIFENSRMVPDHRYYYAGFEAVPNAIVGIHTDYQLVSTAWKKITLTPETLNKLIVRMRAAYTPLPRGAWILGPDGQRLGFWYSSQRVTAIRLSQQTQLRLAPPEPAEMRGIP
jgi:hypothetical protein